MKKAQFSPLADSTLNDPERTGAFKGELFLAAGLSLNHVSCVHGNKRSWHPVL